MKIVILRAGDVLASVAARRGEFDELIRQTAGDAWSEWETIDVRSPDVELPHPRSAAAFVITGSASSVTERAPWMLRTEEFVRTLAAAEAPVLGICFGHQLVAQALGGEVIRNPRGREMGSVEVSVEVTVDPLFDGLPPRFLVQSTHVDTVGTLPPGARVLATTDLEPHAIFSFGRRIRCVQFHPEMDDDVMRGYVEARREAIAADGLDAEAIYRAVKPAPANGAILRNFLSRFLQVPSTHVRE